ncbi:MAG: replicative DNA helicase [Chloroflexota bacterium]|nr:replicative DNA helicase [Chloroflexota bacterium]
MTNSSLTNVPFSQEAEQAVLGAVLLNADAFVSIASFLKAEDFFIARNRDIWAAIERINARRDPIDVVTVQEQLRAAGVLNDIGGLGYLMQLITDAPTSVNAEVYARLVERAAVRRRLMEAADTIKALALDEMIETEDVTTRAERAIFAVTERSLRRELQPLRLVAGDYYEQMELRMQNPDAPTGVPTSFIALDGLLGGLQNSDLLIFAGRPGMGKCVTGDTLIPTERGLLPIVSLKPTHTAGIPDDEGGVYYPLQIGVQTPIGLRQTAYFYASGVRLTRRLTTRAGFTLTGTLNHPVLTLSPSGENCWTPLGELCAGDFVAVQSDDRMAWDGVATLEDSGMQPCYDLTIPDGHAFIGNGIVNHNTSFLLSVAMNAAKFGSRIGIFSMEMGAEQIVQRLVSMETGIDMQRLRLGKLTDDEWQTFVTAIGNLSELRIFIDDTPAMTPLQLRAKCRRLQHEFGLELVIVDYIQLMNAGGLFQNNRVQEISYISRAMKEMARELNVPVFTAAQLSRAVEQRQDKRPQLSDLRESGCVAGDSEVFLPDDGYAVPIRDLIGKVGTNVLMLNFDTWKLESMPITNAFCTGTKPVYKLTTQLGRSIRATANHKFYTIAGWKRLDTLTTDDQIGVPRARLNAQNLTSDVYWDGIVSIEPDGETDVYDLTVPPHANFVCNDITISNSLEQDADVVMFLYRDAVYNEASEEPNRADILIQKHRNGPTGVVSLFFDKRLTKFKNAERNSYDLGDL